MATAQALVPLCVYPRALGAQKQEDHQLLAVSSWAWKTQGSLGSRMATLCCACGVGWGVGKAGLFCPVLGVKSQRPGSCGQPMCATGPGHWRKRKPFVMAVKAGKPQDPAPASGEGCLAVATNGGSWECQSQPCTRFHVTAQLITCSIDCCVEVKLPAPECWGHIGATLYCVGHTHPAGGHMFTETGFTTSP